MIARIIQNFSQKEYDLFTSSKIRAGHTDPDGYDKIEGTGLLRHLIFVFLDGSIRVDIRI